MSKNLLVTASIASLVSLGLIAATYAPTSPPSAAPSSTPATAASNVMPTISPPILKMWRGYVPQIQETVLIVYVSRQPDIAFHDEADKVFVQILPSIRKSNIQVCLIRTAITQTTSGAGGAVIKTSSWEEDVYEKDPDGHSWDKVNDDALVQELSQLGI